MTPKALLDISYLMGSEEGESMKLSIGIDLTL